MWVRRNFFALLVLIPLQRCIPLHQQVRHTYAAGACNDLRCM